MHSNIAEAELFTKSFNHCHVFFFLSFMYNCLRNLVKKINRNFDKELFFKTNYNHNRYTTDTELTERCIGFRFHASEKPHNTPKIVSFGKLFFFHHKQNGVALSRRPFCCRSFTLLRRKRANGEIQRSPSVAQKPSLTLNVHSYKTVPYVGWRGGRLFFYHIHGNEFVCKIQLRMQYTDFGSTYLRVCLEMGYFGWVVKTGKRYGRSYFVAQSDGERISLLLLYSSKPNIYIFCIWQKN